MNIRSLVAVLLLSTVLFSGCLTAEYKEIRLTLNSDGTSGRGVLVFTGISSTPGDTLDVSREDFATLINEYYLGNKIEIENKGMKNVQKKLYMDRGELVGEVTFEFEKLSDLGIYQHNGKGPYMYYTIADGFFTSGQYESSNGQYGGEKLPLVFWQENTREFKIRMALSTPQEERRPLAALFQDWQTNRR